MIHCKFHVGVELVPQQEHVPTFVSLSSESEVAVAHKDRRRTVLHCLVLNCPVVAIDYDADRTDPILCRICKEGYGSRDFALPGVRTRIQEETSAVEETASELPAAQ